MGVWDWLIVLVPLTFIMGMAWYSQRFIRGVADFLAAGCCGIGVGGNLVNKAWIEAGEWEKIIALAQEYRKAVMQA